MRLYSSLELLQFLGMTSERRGALGRRKKYRCEEMDAEYRCYGGREVPVIVKLAMI